MRVTITELFFVKGNLVTFLKKKKTQSFSLQILQKFTNKVKTLPNIWGI